MAIGIASKAGAPPARGGFAGHGARVGIVLALSAFQFVTISWLFDFGNDVPRWSNPVFLLRQLILTGIIALVGFVLIEWPRRYQLLAQWQAADGSGRLPRSLLANGVLFAVLAVATVLLTRADSANGPNPPWHWFYAYSVLLCATGATLALIYAPVRFWIEIARTHCLTLAVAAAVALVVQLASIEAQQGWNGLAWAALAVSFELLAPIDPSAYVDYATQRIGTRQFWVTIDASCSGYEGVALVTMFLAIYMVVFRRMLRFPAALALLPIGILTVWLLNSVRIAVLVLIGGYVSPDIALKGFHSQAGWLSFLAVTIAIMALAHHAPAFNREARALAPTNTADRQALALLAPFMALMLGHIAMAAAAPHSEWLIAVKLAFVALALLAFRDVYRQLRSTICPIAIMAGAVLGVVWILTEPVASERAMKLTEFLSAQPPVLLALWLTMRAVVAAVLVPIAEELAFRGFLYGFIARRGPITLAPAQLSVAAIIVTSLLFGVLHERWLAGAFAGVAFSLIMLRRGQLYDAIIAHIAANAVIVGWAIAAQRWSLL